ncbi:hypothetical protein GALL_450820 [mine drainage metagenome]|uniref:Uncharacterized protein n=1 Tax=mine drainage metagenome TaxID=410659 RepID=A0A1J5PP63_9ZZZZ
MERDPEARRHFSGFGHGLDRSDFAVGRLEAKDGSPVVEHLVQVIEVDSSLGIDRYQGGIGPAGGDGQDLAPLDPTGY